jgi:hypothetical protein
LVEFDFFDDVRPPRQRLEVNPPTGDLVCSLDEAEHLSQI